MNEEKNLLNIYIVKGDRNWNDWVFSKAMVECQLFQELKNLRHNKQLLICFCWKSYADFRRYLKKYFQLVKDFQFGKYLMLAVNTTQQCPLQSFN
jgi:hypothetical protein